MKLILDVFPNVDLYCSSFAGGASGYPLMFDNFDLNQKKKLLKKNSFFKTKKVQKPTSNQTKILSSLC